MIKTVIFDLDGTLADTFKAALSCANRISLKYNKKKIPYTKSMKNMNVWQFIKFLNIPLFKMPFYLKEGQEMFEKDAQKIRMFRGMKPLLKKLKRKYTVGILSSSTEIIIDKIIRANKLDSVDFIFSGSSILGKDRNLRKIIKQKKLKKDETIYIGDEIRDVQACRKVGIKVIAVGWGYNSIKALKKEHPDFLAKTPKDIGEILRRL